MAKPKGFSFSFLLGRGFLRLTVVLLCLQGFWRIALCVSSQSIPDSSVQTRPRGPAAAETPEIYLKTGQAETTSAAVIHTTLARNWSKYQVFKNFDRAGFLQIYLDVLGRKPGFPYFAGLMDSKRLRFVNFGKNGFFVGYAQESKGAGPGGDSKLDDEPKLLPFEDLDWGVTYLTPSTVSRPGFLRDYFVQTHGMSQARKAVQNLLQAGSSRESLRQGYLLVWSGGLSCLSQLREKQSPNNEPSALGKPLTRSQEGLYLPHWMKCDLDTASKVRELDDLSDDDQFYYMISGRPSSSSAKICKAVGVLEENGIEGFGVISGPKGRCVSYRSAFEDNWGTRTKLHCMLPSESKHLWANFDHVDFSFPTANPEQFVLVESRFTPPRLTFVDLARAGYAPIRSATSSQARPKQFGFDAELRGLAASSAEFKGLPKGNYGMYQCLVESRGKSLRQLFFVPSEVYLGERIVETNEDQVFSYLPAKESMVSSEVLSWRDVMNKYPSLDRFPEMSCAYELSVDVKCGIRVLQTAAQIVWEFKTGLFKKAVDSEIRIAGLNILLSLLESLETKLPNWGMNPERQMLKDMILQLLAREKKPPESKEVESVVKSSFKQRAQGDPWQPYLTLPADFWKSLVSEVH